MAQCVRLSLGISAPILECLGTESHLLHFQLSYLFMCQKVAHNGSTLSPPVTHVKDQMEFLVPSFRLNQSWILCASGGVNEWGKVLFSLCVSVTLSDFKISFQKKLEVLKIWKLKQ